MFPFSRSSFFTKTTPQPQMKHRTNRINPLDLPDVVYLVGRHVQLWKASRSGRYTFQPKDLLACVRVNWTWHRTLTPQLWVIFDEFWDIPPSIVEHNSMHIRYLNLPYSKPNPIFRSTLLRQLSTRPWGDFRMASALIRTNPQLNDLSYVPPCKSEGIELDESLSAFDSLFQLRRLKVCKWVNLDTDWLIRTIGNNCDLQELCLVDFTGFQRFDQCPVLKNLTRLCLESPLDENPGFSQLIRYCPNLDSFKYLVTVSRHTSELCRNIWRRTKLSTLDLVGSPSPLIAMPPQTENTYVMLIESLSHLQSFVFDAESLRPRICQVLLNLHCNWLERIDLTVHQPRAEDFSTANKILASCPNLVSFAMRAIYFLNSWRPVDCLAMFSRPWTCPRLLKVQVTGFPPTAEPVCMKFDREETAETPTMIGAPNDDDNVDHILSAYGWTAVHASDDREPHLAASDHRMLLGAFLEKTSTCPGLCEITLNSFVCIQAKH